MKNLVGSDFIINFAPRLKMIMKNNEILYVMRVRTYHWW